MTGKKLKIMTDAQERALEKKLKTDPEWQEYLRSFCTPGCEHLKKLPDALSDSDLSCLKYRKHLVYYDGPHKCEQCLENTK